MQDSNFPILGNGVDDRHQMMLDEARKRGVLSPGGIFALLGELDYYQLIENLTRGPITERQLMTPYRWWLFFKGSAFATIISGMLGFFRVALLISGETLDFRFKFSAFLIVNFLVLFGFGFSFLKYTKYPDGATWTAVKYCLAGFSVGVVFTETVKHVLIMLTIYLKKFIALNVYHVHWILDEVLEIYYDFFIDDYTEEVISLGICYISIVYFWLYFQKVSKIRRAELQRGKPYDLGVA